MGKIIKFLLPFAVLAGLLNAADYEIDPAHSNIGFSAKHLKITKVHGNFTTYQSKISYDKFTNRLTKLEADIEAKSVNTQNQKRDAHLVEEVFFYAEKFPKIKFKMIRFEKKNETKGKIYGNITIRDITKPIELDFEYGGENRDKHGVEKIGLNIEGSLLRSDFNIGEKYPDSLISNKIEIKIDIEAMLK